MAGRRPEHAGEPARTAPFLAPRVAGRRLPADPAGAGRQRHRRRHAERRADPGAAAGDPRQDDGASSISADGQALLVNGGPGDTVARMHFTLPARTVHGDPWVVWVERKPVERMQLAGEG